MLSTQLYSKFEPMNEDLVRKVSILLQESHLSDAEIALQANVSREMVYKWRNRKVKAIRKSNLHLVSKALGYKVVVNKLHDKVELIPIESIINKENLQLSQSMTEMIITTQNSQIQDLLTDKTFLKEEITILKNKNVRLQTKLKRINKD